MRTSSLSRQLIAGVLLAELICAAAFSFVAVEHELHGRRHAFDIMLRGRADSLLGAVQDAEDPEDNVAVDPAELTVPKQDIYEVLSPSGRAIGQSSAVPSALTKGLTGSNRPSYFNFKANGTWYRGLCFDGIRIIDRAENIGGLRRPVTVLYASPTHDLWHETIEAVRFYVLASALLLAVTGILLVWFLRRSLSPLEELALIAGRVSASSWEFVPPTSVLGTAELAPIAISIQQLLQGLRLAFERQRQLTGDAAHELKTSIAVLKSSLQLLSMNPRTQEQYAVGLEGLLHDTERMEDLATRMLTLGRLEEAPAELTGPSDLSATLQAVVARLQPLAALQQITLEVSADDTGNVAIHTDDAEVLCSNLIMNALQHSSSGGRVSASLHTSAGFTELRITDHGDGISEEALPHVFERFYRADRSRSRISGGAGLGLSICKAIVERADGTIRISSAAGSGTEVCVTLPAVPADESHHLAGNV